MCSVKHVLQSGVKTSDSSPLANRSQSQIVNSESGCQNHRLTTKQVSILVDQTLRYTRTCKQVLQLGGGRESSPQTYCSWQASLRDRNQNLRYHSKHTCLGRVGGSNITILRQSSPITHAPYLVTPERLPHMPIPDVAILYTLLTHPYISISYIFIL